MGKISLTRGGFSIASGQIFGVTFRELNAIWSISGGSCVCHAACSLRQQPTPPAGELSGTPTALESGPKKDPLNTLNSTGRAGTLSFHRRQCRPVQRGLAARAVQRYLGPHPQGFRDA
jgi:hypothetical protein